MKCRSCLEEILDGARVCSRCGSAQDWWSALHLSSTVLALSVALLSVLSVVGPALRSAWKSDSDISVRSVGLVSSEWAAADSTPGWVIVASNRGGRPGVVAPIATLVWDGVFLTLKAEPIFLAPGQGALMTLRPEMKGGYRDPTLETEPKKCEIEVTEITFRGRNRVRRIDGKGQDWLWSNCYKFRVSAFEWHKHSARQPDATD
jgi:hypothetical protein